MMDRKWTPGPWVWVKPNRWPDHQMEEQGLGRFKSGHVSVCEFGHNAQFYPSEGVPPNDADGNLIAAAPDLYEALEDLAEKMASYMDDESVQLVASALAKARGETQ